MLSCMTVPSGEFTLVFLPVFKKIFAAPVELRGTPSPMVIFLSQSIVNIVVSVRSTTTG